MIQQTLTLSFRWPAIALVAALSALLPLLILVSGAPISDPDVARHATFHLRSDFWLRAAATFVYFPAIIALHFAIQPAAGNWRALYLCGLCLFVAGNAIDLPFRAVQFFTVGGVWGAEWLAAASDAPARAATAAKIATFAQIAPAISFSFTVLFAVGRFMMGAALWAAGGIASRIAGAGVILTGVWNMAAVLKSIPALAFLDQLGGTYLWIWLAGILAVGTGGIIAGRSEVPRR